MCVIQEQKLKKKVEKFRTSDFNRFKRFNLQASECAQDTACIKTASVRSAQRQTKTRNAAAVLLSCPLLLILCRSLPQAAKQQQSS